MFTNKNEESIEIYFVYVPDLSARLYSITFQYNGNELTTLTSIRFVYHQLWLATRHPHRVPWLSMQAQLILAKSRSSKQE